MYRVMKSSTGVSLVLSLKKMSGGTSLFFHLCFIQTFSFPTVYFFVPESALLQ